MTNHTDERLRSRSQSPNRSTGGRVNESCNTDMEAFYASLFPSLTARTTPSEETQKAIQILRGLLSKEFSFLVHPGRSIVMKDTLKYLLTLPPGEEGFSMTAKSLMLQLSHSFPHWRLDYDNASLKVETTTTMLSKAEKMKDDLEANVQEFQKMEKNERCLFDELAQLLEEKRDLEEKISEVKSKIANCTQKIDNVTEKKLTLFHKGREVKAEVDDLRRLKAEQEWAKIRRAEIDAEWSSLRERFNTCVDLEKLI